MTDGFLVLGQGAVGRRLARALSASGRPVTACDRDGWQEALLGHRGPVLLSLHRGDDSVGVATSLAGHDHGVDVVVDLTTQSTATAVAADRLAKAGGARYWAGGLTGGAAALERAEGVFLLGPPDLPQPVRTALAHAGRVVDFTTATVRSTTTKLRAPSDGSWRPSVKTPPSSTSTAGGSRTPRRRNSTKPSPSSRWRVRKRRTTSSSTSTAGRSAGP